jgi:NADH:ubiquinone oxidoreductase subunit 2 (subunit N)
LVFLNNFLDSAVISFFYMFVYNFSLLTIFWTFQNFISSNFKVISSFKDFRFNPYFVFLTSVIFFSMAGVPPFLGFFSKILILVNLTNSNFFFLYTFFFGLLFLGLYFYIQNIRFLFSLNASHMNYSFNNNIRVPSLYLYITYVLVFFLIFAFLFVDDLLLYFYWIFS